MNVLPPSLQSEIDLYTEKCRLKLKEDKAELDSSESEYEQSENDSNSSVSDSDVSDSDVSVVSDSGISMDTEDSEYSEDWSDEESSCASDDEPDEDHYGKGDGYYDYLHSEFPRDGITWDHTIHALGVESKQDMTKSISKFLKNNRLTNAYPDRESLPSPLDLLNSSFFDCWKMD